MKKRFKEWWINWLLPVDYSFYFLIDDLNAYSDEHLSGIYTIPFEKEDVGTKIKYYIKGVELPDSSGEIEITII